MQTGLPGDCVVGDWGVWTDCEPVAGCGDGLQRRVRNITQHPSYGGQGCPALIQQRTCKSEGCPVASIQDSPFADVVTAAIPLTDNLAQGQQADIDWCGDWNGDGVQDLLLTITPSSASEELLLYVGLSPRSYLNDTENGTSSDWGGIKWIELDTTWVPGQFGRRLRVLRATVNAATVHCMGDVNLDGMPDLMVVLAASDNSRSLHMLEPIAVHWYDSPRNGTDGVMGGMVVGNVSAAKTDLQLAGYGADRLQTLSLRPVMVSSTFLHLAQILHPSSTEDIAPGSGHDQRRRWRGFRLLGTMLEYGLDPSPTLLVEPFGNGTLTRPDRLNEFVPAAAGISAYTPPTCVSPEGAIAPSGEGELSVSEAAAVVVMHCYMLVESLRQESGDSIASLIQVNLNAALQVVGMAQRLAAPDFGFDHRYMLVDGRLRVLMPGDLDGDGMGEMMVPVPGLAALQMYGTHHPFSDRLEYQEIDGATGRYREHFTGFAAPGNGAIVLSFPGSTGGAGVARLQNGTRLSASPAGHGALFRPDLWWSSGDKQLGNGTQQNLTRPVRPGGSGQPGNSSGSSISPPTQRRLPSREPLPGGGQRPGLPGRGRQLQRLSPGGSGTPPTGNSEPGYNRPPLGGGSLIVPPVPKLQYLWPFGIGRPRLMATPSLDYGGDPSSGEPAWRRRPALPFLAAVRDEGTSRVRSLKLGIVWLSVTSDSGMAMDSYAAPHLKCT